VFQEINKEKDIKNIEIQKLRNELLDSKSLEKDEVEKIVNEAKFVSHDDNEIEIEQLASQIRNVIEGVAR